MEDTFKVRVDKAFGSLEASSSSTSIKPTSSSLNSLWCLTDEEIERNKWIQDNYDLESDIQELDDEEDDGESENRQQELSKPDDHSNEDWSIRSSVGMDSTLDNEGEEDAYDKVAAGNEELTEILYMKDINDYEVEMDSNTQLPSSFTDVIRDPRANRMAAKLRLKEDDESARKLGLQVSENNIQESSKIATELKKQLVMNKPSGSKVVPFFPQKSSSLPDYVRNPSNYTHYTFDSKDDVDEESNQKVFMDLFNSLKGSDPMETQDNVSNNTPTSVIFTPKK